MFSISIFAPNPIYRLCVTVYRHLRFRCTADERSSGNDDDIDDFKRQYKFIVVIGQTATSALHKVV